MTDHRIVFETHGLMLEVSVPNATLVPAVEEILPPGWVPSQALPEDGHLRLVANGSGGYDVTVDGTTASSGLEEAAAIRVLDAQLRAHIAFAAPARIFVHAGVVAVGDRAILIPGLSFTGKTTLVAALVAAGATYLSDEFAVLDEAGLVHPYPKTLSIRADGELRGERTPVEALGGTAGDRALVPALIASLVYRPGAEWAPEELAPGAGALELLLNTIPAKSRPVQTLTAVGNAARKARVLKGERGEASATAKLLLGYPEFRSGWALG